MLTLAGTVIGVLLVGFDVPARLNRLTDRDAVADHPATPQASQSPASKTPTGAPRIRSGEVTSTEFEAAR